MRQQLARQSIKVGFLKYEDNLVRGTDIKKYFKDHGRNTEEELIQCTIQMLD